MSEPKSTPSVLWHVVVIVIVLAFSVLLIWNLSCVSRPERDSTPSTGKTAESVGNSVGSSSKGFLSGFRKGWSNRKERE